MPAKFKAKIACDEDGEYTISCKQLDISQEGSGDIEEMMTKITEAIREKVAEEFRNMPRAITLTSYSMSLNYSVVGPVNRSLEEFSGGYTATIRMGDGTEIPLDKLTKTADKVIEYAKRTGKSVDEVLAEAKARLDREKKAKSNAKGAKTP